MKPTWDQCLSYLADDPVRLGQVLDIIQYPTLPEHRAQMLNLTGVYPPEDATADTIKDIVATTVAGWKVKEPKHIRADDRWILFCSHVGIYDDIDIGDTMVSEYVISIYTKEAQYHGDRHIVSRIAARIAANYPGLAYNTELHTRLRKYLLGHGNHALYDAIIDDEHQDQYDRDAEEERNETNNG